MAHRQYFGHAFRADPKLDLDELLKRLSDPTDRSYAWADGATVEILRKAREAYDPSVIPIWCKSSIRYLRRPGISLMRFRRPCCFTPRSFLARSAGSREKRLAGTTGGRPVACKFVPDPRALEAAKVLEARRPRRQARRRRRCVSLAGRVRQGRLEDAPALLQAVDELVTRRGFTPPACQGLKSLLDSGSPAAHAQFLEYMSRVKHGQINIFSHERVIIDMTSLLHPLFPEHTAAYIDQVLQLLRSNLLRDAKGGPGVSCVYA